MRGRKGAARVKRINAAPPASTGDQTTTAAARLTDASTPQRRLDIEAAEAPGPGYTFAKAARRTKIGSHELKTFFLALAAFCRATDHALVARFRAQVSTIAAQLECRRSTAVDKLAALEAIGHLTRRRTGRASEYTLIAVPIAALAGATADAADGRQTAPSDGRQTAPSDLLFSVRSDLDPASKKDPTSGGGTRERTAPPPPARSSRGKTRSQISFAQDLGLDPNAYPNGVELGEAIEKANAERCSSRTGGSFMDVVDDWPPKSCTACGADLRGETFDPEKGCPRPECGSPDFATPTDQPRPAGGAR